jgi:hypothetical protein
VEAIGCKARARIGDSIPRPPAVRPALSNMLATLDCPLVHVSSSATPPRRSPTIARVRTLVSESASVPADPISPTRGPVPRGLSGHRIAQRVHARWPPRQTPTSTQGTWRGLEEMNTATRSLIHGIQRPAPGRSGTAT